MPDKTGELLSLAREALNDPTPAEEKLIRAIANAEPANYHVSPDAPDNPSVANPWGVERTLRATFIRWLCVNSMAAKLYATDGVRIVGAKVVGELKFDYTVVDVPIVLDGCSVMEPISMKCARVRTLELTGTHVSSIEARGIHVDGRLYLNKGFTANGTVCLSEAQIGGSLICDGGKFRNQNAYAVSADASEIKGSISLKNCEIQGRVNLSGARIQGDLVCNGNFNDPGPRVLRESIYIKETGEITSGLRERLNLELVQGVLTLDGATIGGNLVCSNCKFGAGSGDALRAVGLKVTGDLLLDKEFVANNMVLLDGTSIGGNLDCDNAKFLNKGVALSAQRVQVKASIRLTNCEAVGAVNLYGAVVEGNLRCTNSQFDIRERNQFGATGTLTKATSLDPELIGVALLAAGAKVNGHLLLNNTFRAAGAVVLDGATIVGNLTCSGGHFDNLDKDALRAIGAKISGSVSLDSWFEAKGKVILDEATIGGNLKCSGYFDNAKKDALKAIGTKVAGDVLLSEEYRKFHVKGAVRLDGATIGGNMQLGDSTLENTTGVALSMERADVKGGISLTKCAASGALNLSQLRIGSALTISGMANPGKINTLDLRFTIVTTLDHAEDSWPKHDETTGEKHYLYLNGLTYSAVSATFQPNKEQCVRWLQLQPATDFSSQPYEQLAKTLKSMGDEPGMKRVLIAKQDDLRERGRLKAPDSWLNWFLGITMKHGYEPNLILIGMLVFVSLGTWLFHLGCHHKAMSRLQSINSSQPQDYPQFQAFVYSIDTFIPFIDLKQKNYWSPSAGKGGVAIVSPIVLDWGTLIRIYLWIHTILGWIITTLWVAGFTGLVRRLT